MNEKEFFDQIEGIANDIADMGCALELCFYGVHATKEKSPMLNSVVGGAFDFFSRRAKEMGSILVNTKEEYERIVT